MPTGARTATRVRKPKVDKLSTTPAGAETTLQMRGLVVLPRTAFESGRGWVTYEGRDVYVLESSSVNDGSGWRKYEDGDVVATDLLDVDGARWQVDGPPAAYDKESTRKATLIRIKKVGT